MKSAFRVPVLLGEVLYESALAFWCGRTGRFSEEGLAMSMFKCRRALFVLATVMAGSLAAGQAAGRTAKGAKKTVKKGKAEAKKPGARGFNLPKAGTIDAKLGKKLALTAKQKALIEKVREELKAKYVAVNNKAAVIRAKAKLKAAREKKDKKAAEKAKAMLTKATGGFVASAEYRKALEEILNKKQFAAYTGGAKAAAEERAEKTDSKKGKAPRKARSKKG